MTLTLTRYHGGKTKMAQWIIDHMPGHKVYVEPYGGMASVLLTKKSALSEVYNDKNKEVFNLFKMVRERGEELAHVLNMTTFSRDELELAYIPSEDNVESARRFLVRAEMSISSTSMNERTGFRSAINKDYSSQFFTFYKRPDVILKVRDRLARVCIENTEAKNIIERFDSKETLFYLYPPYVNETRGKSSVTRGYLHNMTNQDHLEMLELALKLKGKVIISGYDNELYRDMLKDWNVKKTTSYDDARRAKTEVIWMNYQLSNQIKINF